MNTAQKGAKLEREIINLLREHGWNVLRGAGSKGEVTTAEGDQFKADFIATKLTDQTSRELWIVAMQAKVKRRRQ